MNPFIYENPTKIKFGIGSLNTLAEEICRFGSRVLFLYGGGSIFKNGAYDQVTYQLNRSGCFVVEHGGVVGNPRLFHANAGVALIKEHKIDLILAVGGGSVIDEAKAIAAGALYNGDLWDFYCRKSAVISALPIISVQTLPATASEMNGFSVLTHDTSHEKSAIGFPPTLNPRVSFLDPSFSTTVSSQQTGFAAADILSHLTEGYFTTSAEMLYPQDEIIEGIARSVIDAANTLMIDPSNLEARSSLMWSATLAWNGSVQAGIPDALLPCHALEMPLSGIYDIAHGAGLAILTPHWMRAMDSVHGKRIIRFGSRVFGIESSVELVAQQFESLYKEWGIPRSIKGLGVESIDIDLLTKDGVTSFSRRNINGYDESIVRKIYEAIG